MEAVEQRGKGVRRQWDRESVAYGDSGTEGLGCKEVVRQRVSGVWRQRNREPRA
jgi:hypothetical protein